MIQWPRTIAIVLISILFGVLVGANDFSLLETPILTFISIINAVAVTLAIYIMTTAAQAVENTISHLKQELARRNAPPATAAELNEISKAVKKARLLAYKNAKALIVFAAVYVLVLAWSRMDFPYFSWSTSWWFTKGRCIHAVCFSLAFLSLGTLYDLLGAARNIGELSDPPPSGSTTSGKSEKG